MSLPKTIIKKLNPHKLRESLLSFPTRAKNERWVLVWDKLVDSLYFTPSKIPQGNVLFGLTHELNIYINSKSEINGIFIENFSTNFVKHNEEFEDMLEAMKKKIDGDLYTPADNKKSDLYSGALEASLFEILGNKDKLLHPDFLGV